MPGGGDRKKEEDIRASLEAGAVCFREVGWLLLLSGLHSLLKLSSKREYVSLPAAGFFSPQSTFTSMISLDLFTAQPVRRIRLSPAWLMVKLRLRKGKCLA